MRARRFPSTASSSEGQRLFSKKNLFANGMWVNNPVGLAVVEAIGVLGWSKEDLRVLSVGCTSTPLNVRLGRVLPLGLIYWGMKSADIFMSGQSSAARGTAELLAGKENVIRIDPIAPEGRFKLDDVQAIDSLKGLGVAEARKAMPMIRARFLDAPAEPFEPYHKLA